MSTSGISIALVDEHAVLRDAFGRLLLDEGFKVVGNFSSPAEFAAIQGCDHVDVIVMGLIFSGFDGLRCIADWSKEFTNTRILVLSQLPEMTYAERVLNAGASGYLMKSASLDTVMAAVHRVAQREVAVSRQVANRLLARATSRFQLDGRDDLDCLSDRELHVLSLVGQGYANASIAAEMGVSKKTVDSFKERIKSKLSLSNSAQLAQAAAQYLGRFQ